MRAEKVELLGNVLADAIVYMSFGDFLLEGAEKGFAVELLIDEYLKSNGSQALLGLLTRTIVSAGSDGIGRSIVDTLSRAALRKGAALAESNARGHDRIMNTGGYDPD